MVEKMRKQPNKSSTTGCGEKQHSNSATRKRPGFQKGNPYRFKSGESGNPNGRPKYRTLSESIRAYLEQPTDNRKGSPTLAEAIATAVLKKARKGDVRAFEAVANRAEGKAPQTIKHSDVSELERLVLRVQERVIAQTGVQMTREAAIEHIIAYRPELAGQFDREL